MSQSDWLVVISFIGIIVLVFCPVILVSRRRNKEEKKDKKQLESYMTGERNRLLESYFPDCQYFYDKNFSMNMDYNCQAYAFYMEKRFQNYCVKMKHVVEVFENDRPEERTTYCNLYTMNVVPHSKGLFLLPGSFMVEAGAFSFVKSMEKLGEKFADKDEIMLANQTRKSDVIALGKAGKISYENIAKSDWDDFVSTGILNHLEQLLILLQDLSYVRLRYMNGKLELTFHDRKGEAIYYRAYACLKNDFVVKHANLFHQIMDVMNEIAENMQTYK